MESGWNSIQNLPLYYFDEISTCMFFICYLHSVYFPSTFCLLSVYIPSTFRLHSACYLLTAPLCFYISCLSSPYVPPHKATSPVHSSLLCPQWRQTCSDCRSWNNDSLCSSSVLLDPTSSHAFCTGLTSPLIYFTRIFCSVWNFRAEFLSPNIFWSPQICVI